MPLRRLTRREYNNTVRDLLGDTSNPADSFPPDSDASFLFRRAGLVSSQDALVLRSAAESLAAKAVGNLKALLPCDPASGEAACARQFVEQFGMRAFRRPLVTAERDRLVGLYETGRSTLKLGFNDAIGLVIEAALQAPGFLYHWEHEPGGSVAREGAVVRLGPYEMASRLSYFLWGTMPSKELFAAAAANKLSTAAEVEAQARQMLADPRAKETIGAFFEEWLDLDALRDRSKDPMLYPAYNDALKDAMIAETRAFAQAVFTGDGKFETLLGAPFSFVNQALGAIYGTTQVKGSALVRQDLDPGQRRGFLTHAAFLANTGAADGSHPVRRGVAIYERLLCRHLPPPPPDVPPARSQGPGTTTRERFAEHGKDECGRACHSLIDPLGFAFETYDGIGKHRTMENGKRVDASGATTLDDQMRTFDDAIGLIGHLAKSAEVASCFSGEWMRFALSRPETQQDEGSFKAVATAFAREGNLRDLLVAVTTSRSFRYRSPGTDEVLP
jgi:hypothetical protein